MMFDKKTLEAYKSIGPPPQLRRRVMDLDAARIRTEMKLRKRKTLYRACAFAAACLALVMTLSMLTWRSPAQLVLYAEGQAVSAGQSVAAPLPNSQLRTAMSAPREQALTVLLTLSAQSRAALNVSVGTLACYDAGSGEALDAHKPLKGEMLLYWTIDTPDPEQGARLTVAGKDKRLQFLLYFDTIQNQWMIYLENEKE